MNNTLSNALHTALFHWAQSQPEQPFLLAEPMCSYQQAANYVGALATVLQPTKRTAIWLEKNNHYVLAILASLTARSAYVPIDAKQPTARVSLILGDAEVDTLIVDSTHLTQAIALQSEYPNIRIIEIRKTGTSTPNITSFNWFKHIHTSYKKPKVSFDNNDLAAILFTSGSTGRPKGVKLSIKNLLHFINWCQQSLSLSSTHRFLNIASFNFDLSTFDLFMSLTVGGSLYVTSEDVVKQPLLLANILKEQKINVMYTVPSLLNLMNRIALWQQAQVLSLTHIIFAGEVMPKSCLRTLNDNIQHCQFFNFYGPTETNVCLAYSITDEDIISDGAIPIGTPFGDSQVQLIGEDNAEIPQLEGAIGELVVRGSCVTPGYCNEGQQSKNHQQHLHKTGDIVQFAAGKYYFLGRRDRMIKVAGFRIELGEIEARLSLHESITEVATRYCIESAKIIATYSPTNMANKPSAIELKAYCAEHLPVYMIPHRFKALSKLPKNANGKIDYPQLAKVECS
ncbi:AMP-binding protein [Pseudoalteromonas sp. MMG013]|uniref:AMP-binding protein n=1 Tax=Pseudoalteromonas sp. MMG013 TaxID=2822687 RepID=UPI001B372ED8|nr:AMP-binding protein [Pseudoalteromonas sp. MMG013]MBQ4863674.1 AMP-binding protein [Pseudoalteromonas sp. MMG013]